MTIKLMMHHVAQARNRIAHRINPLKSLGVITNFSTTNDKIREQAQKWHRHNSGERGSYRTVSIDRSSLRQPAPINLESVRDTSQKSKETPLVHILRTMIEVKGPITVSEFMQRALGHPELGYYMKKDVFGVQGDFTTAPEISQMFGELIGVWCVATWQQMGCPASIQVIEIGPGRGSLMKDFLRAAASFPSFYQAIELHMVEMSPAMRVLQQQALGCEEDIENGKMRVGGTGPLVQWHEELGTVPQQPCLVIAQELFDALPVHQFEYTDKGWCERLVDVDYEEGDHHFRFTLSPGPTPATRVYIGREKLFDPSNIVPHSPVSTSSAIQRLDVADPSRRPIQTAQARIGDCVEISPVGIALMQDISKRVADHGGGALIVDYGHDHPSELSLRGIKHHEFVSPLAEPGEVDLSIDVDFATLRKYATQHYSSQVQTYGPIGQGAFLKAMGIEHRLHALLQSTSQDPTTQEELFTAYERLVDADQMGTIFKAMAITHKSIGQPVGFDTVESD